MKRCFKCGVEKNLSEFYRHPQMGDGFLGKCKECTKADVATRYRLCREKIREYERIRFKNPERKKKVRQYASAMKNRNPEKYAARIAVGNAIRSGRLQRKPCEVCGEQKVQAHHTDYLKPLDVQWLCFRCHRVHGHGQIVGERQ